MVFFLFFSFFMCLSSSGTGSTNIVHWNDSFGRTTLFAWVRLHLASSLWFACSGGDGFLEISGVE